MDKPLRAPFPAFGGKSRVASLIWQRLGNPDNFVEPFANSAAVLLLRPHPPRIETLNETGDFTNTWRATDPEHGEPLAVANAFCEVLNDLDPYIANVWRSIKEDPEATAEWADQPVHELTLHAIHRWLVLGEDAAAFRERLRTDPDYYCPRRAGRWLAGACMWIGGGWAVSPQSEAMPKVSEGRTFGGTGVHGDHLSQQVPRAIGGRNGAPGDAGGPRPGEQLPDLSSGSVGVHAAGTAASERRPRLENHGPGQGVHKTADLAQGRPQLADAYSRGRGVHDDNHLSEKRPHLGTGHEDGQGGRDLGNGVHRPSGGGTCEQRRAWLVAWFSRLRDRLRTVRVCCGHWLRVCDSESVTTRLGTTGLMLDPPYPTHGADGAESRSGGLYATDGGRDALDVLRDEVLAYCLERGGNQKMRIAVCGYSGDGYEALLRHGWEEVAWKSQGGYANRNKANVNRGRERIWFSPHCLKAREPGLFDTIDEGGAP